jgi:hypothetical protein
MLAVAAGWLLAPAGLSNADPLTFTFAGELDPASIDDVTGFFGGATSFMGTYTFESTTPDTSGDPVRGIYPGVSSFSVTIGGQTVSVDSLDDGSIVVNNDNVAGPFDSYFVGAIGADQNSHYVEEATLSLVDHTASVFQSDALPLTPPGTASFDERAFFIAINLEPDQDEPAFAIAEGAITSLTPEPGTMGLLGIAAVSVLTRRKR